MKKSKDIKKILILMVLVFFSFSAPVYSQTPADFVNSRYIRGNAGFIRVNTPASLPPLSSILGQSITRTPTSTGLVITGSANYKLPSGNLPVKLASKITPVSIAKAVAKSAFRPVPLLLAAAVGEAIIKKYGDNIYNGSEWMKPQTSLYSNYTFGHSGVTGGSLDSVIAQMKTVFFSSYNNVTYKLGTMSSGRLPITFNYTDRQHGWALSQSTVLSYSKNVSTSVKYVLSDEPTLTTQVAQELMNNPALVSSLLDQLASNNIYPSATRSVPTGPVTIDGTAETVTTTNSRPKDVVYDPTTNTTTTKTYTDNTTKLTTYNMNYGPDSITVTPTTSTTTKTTTTTNVTNNTTNLTTTTNNIGDPTTTTTTKAPPPLQPDTQPKQPPPNYSLSYTDTPEPKAIDFYKQKYPLGIGDVWTKKSSLINQTPLFKLISSFVAAPASGSCPAWDLDLNIMTGANFGTHNIAPPCSLWSIIKGIVLISAFFASRQIIFGG